MQAKSIGADALRRFFSGMLDKVAPVMCPRCEETETGGGLCGECLRERIEDEECDRSCEDWRWEGSPGRV